MPPSRFAKRPNAVSLAVVAAHLGFVFAPIYLAAVIAPSPWLVALWVWFGLGMNGLLNLMHEASHFHVFHERWANDLLGGWILGPLTLADFDGYRLRHWDHHRRLGEPDDPKVTYHLDVRGHHMVSLLLRCLFLVEAVRKFRHQAELPDAGEPAPGSSLTWVARTLLVHALFAGSIMAPAWLAHGRSAMASVFTAALAYDCVYVYGLASLTVFAASLRAIAEHQIGPDGAPHVGQAALRNFTCNPFTRLVLGAYGFGEHATHHEIPGIPYYRLEKASLELAEKNAAFAPTYSYWSTLWTLVHPRNAASTPEHEAPKKKGFIRVFRG